MAHQWVEDRFQPVISFLGAVHVGFEGVRRFGIGVTQRHGGQVCCASLVSPGIALCRLQSRRQVGPIENVSVECFKQPVLQQEIRDTYVTFLKRWDSNGVTVFQERIDLRVERIVENNSGCFAMVLMKR